MHLIKLSNERFINPNKISEIFISEDNYIYIRADGIVFRWSKYADILSAREGLTYLVDYIHNGGSDLYVYRELDGFEKQVWDTYCLIDKDKRNRLMAKCMLICSDPDALLLMKPDDISSMLLENGMPWYDYNMIDNFQKFLEGNMKTHPDWFEMRE